MSHPSQRGGKSSWGGDISAYAGLMAQRDGTVSTAEFRSLYAEVSTWARWPARAEHGSLNHLTPDRLIAAARLVRDGVTVSLSRPLDTESRLDNPEPAEHRMTQMPADDIGSGTVRFAKDYIGIDFHNHGHSHIDAFSHVVFDNSLYGGIPDDPSPRRAPIRLDRPAPRRPGRPRRAARHTRAAGSRLARAGEQVRPDGTWRRPRPARAYGSGPGDTLLVRTGHTRRLAELTPWDPEDHKAGLHPTAVRFLAERQVTALGSDSNSDAVPSTTEGIAFPVHVLAVHAMGVYLMDYLDLERLATVCAAAGRWEFLFVVAPLRITGGTGSPVNPIAIF